VEDKNMLAENLENLVKKERLEGRQEGRKEGRQEGAEGILRKLITLKYGELPGWTEQQLANATSEQLDDWALRLMTARTLEELFRQ